MAAIWNRFRREATTAVVWAVAGIAISAYAVLREADALLGRIAGADGRGFDAGTFTSLSVRFYDTTDLAAALRLWTAPTSPDAEVATRILQFHVVADFFFIAAYGYLLWGLLRWVGVGPSVAMRAPIAMAAADWAETTLFGIAVAARSTWSPLLVAVQWFSLVKWAAFAVVVMAAAIAFVRGRAPAGGTTPGPYRFNLEAVGSAIGAWRRNERFPVPLAIAGQLGLVAVFAVLVGAPGGSILAQVPDVIRAQVDPLVPGSASNDITPLLLSTVALVLLIVAAITSTTIGGEVPAAYPQTIGSAIPLAVAFIISGVLALLSLIVDRTLRLSAWAPLLVVAAVAFAAWIAARSGRDLPRPRIATATGVVGPPDALGAEGSAAPRDPIVTDEGLSRWASAIGAVILMAGGVGLIRAAIPVVILGSAPAIWYGVAALGLIVVVIGGTGLQILLSRPWLLAILASPRRRQGLVIVVVLVVALLTALLALRPADARHWGSNGTVAIAFSAYALVIGGLQRLGRSTPPWRATQRLGLGPRTPYGFLVVAVWVTSSFVNTDPGYHEIPTITLDERAAPDEARYGSIDEAFGAWVDANLDASCGRPDAADPAAGPTADPTAEPATVPLVLVAAPGGGMRAAYWTGSTLEALFPAECRHRVFAASGTSGGAVGISVWAAISTSMAMASSIDGSPIDGSIDGSIDGDPSGDGVEDDGPALASLQAMSEDRALAAAVATLLLRDLPQPFVAVHGGWADRAEILERAWITSTLDETPSGVAPFGPDVERARPLSDLGPGSDPDGWAPIIVLNSASVVDGCRVLLTTINALPTAADGDCLSTEPVAPAAGPARVAIDPVPLLTADGRCEPDRAPLDVSIGSAALASARWPYVTPSGSMQVCVDRGSGPAAEDLYLVDGGYYENSGILAILEIWSELEPLVEAFNAEAGDGGVRIEPWILFLDSGYRSGTPIPPADRPLELFVPLQTLLSNSVIGSSALEQRAALAMDRFHGPAPEAGGQPDDVEPSPDGTCQPFYARVGPTQRPEVAAPLGWVLSGASRRSLDGFRDEVLASPAACVADLVAQLQPGATP